MVLEVNNELGHVSISDDVISTVAGGTAVSWGKENYSKGIVVKQDEDKLVIDLYIIVMYGTKISEIASNVQSSVKYQIEKTLGAKVNEVNIFIQGIKVSNK